MTHGLPFEDYHRKRTHHFRSRPNPSTINLFLLLLSKVALLRSRVMR